MKHSSASALPLAPDRLPDTFALERHLASQGYARVAGVDEAGRGPLAGPVVAACVVLPPACDFAVFQDSKKLTARRRQTLFDILAANGSVIGVGMAGPEEIEQLNILQASLLAMSRAMDACVPHHGGPPPDFLLVDGKFQVPAPVEQWTLIKGESKSASIAAASIIAKVTRDRIMAEAHVRFPQYGFARHQGYPTQSHREAIQRHGPCVLHRRTFRGVREHLAHDALLAAFKADETP